MSHIVSGFRLAPRFSEAGYPTPNILLQDLRLRDFLLYQDIRILDILIAPLCMDILILDIRLTPLISEAAYPTPGYPTPGFRLAPRFSDA